MKKCIYFCVLLLAVALASCGSDNDEPQGKRGEIICKASITPKPYSTPYFWFYLFPGGGYTELLEKQDSQAIGVVAYAKKSSGEVVQGIGNITQHGYDAVNMLPLYNSASKGFYDIYQGEFTIIAAYSINGGFCKRYMIKQFTKKWSDDIMITPNFAESDFDLSVDFKQIPWR